MPTPEAYTACMHCGSFDLRIPSVSGGDALFPGSEELMGTAVCPQCGWKGVPVEFDSMEDLEEFRRSRAGAPPVTAEDFTSAFPRADATPRSGLVPLGLIVIGVAWILLAAAITILQTSEGNPGVAFTTALIGAAIGFPLIVIGWRQAGGRREAAAARSP